MKYPEEFSHEAVNKRSLKAARSLDSYRRSSKVKTDLDDARMDKKERRPLKEFTELRAELIDENVSVAHTTMPPNILILRRKTVRQFPNNTMVALYFNDKLNQYFSIPYGSGVESVVSPVNVNINEEHQPGDTVRYRLGTEGHLRVGTVKQVMPEHLVVNRGGFHYKVPHAAVVHNERTGYTRKELNEETVLEMRDLSHPSQVKAYYGAQRKYEQWAGDFEDHVLDTNAAHTGKIDWDTAHSLHKQGHKPDVAAKKYTDSHPTPFESHFHKEEVVNEISIPVASRAYHARQQRGLDAMNKGDYSTALPHFKKALTTMRLRSKKYEREVKVETVKEDVIQEDVISHLQKVKAFATNKPLYHKDGSQTRVDPTTANALLTVHGALHPDNRKKFADALEHSKGKFNRMLDFTWRQVK